MSTKIYNGYILKGIYAPEVFDMCRAMSVRVRKKQEELTLRCIVDCAISTLDKRTLGHPINDIEMFDYKHNPDKSALCEGASYCLNRHMAMCRRRERDPGFDFDFEIAFVQARPKMLALAYVENKELLEIFTSWPNVEECGYWDNTDGPEELSEEEWCERGRVWDKALGPTSTPAHVCLSFKLDTMPLVTFTKENVEKTIVELGDEASLDNRVEYCVRNEIMRTLLTEDMSYSQFTALFNTEEVVARRAELAKEYAKRLGPVVTYEALTRRPE